MGANGWRRLRDITLPLTTPGYISGALLVFIWTFADFITPLVLGVQDLLLDPARLGLRDELRHRPGYLRVRGGYLDWPPGALSAQGTL